MTTDVKELEAGIQGMVNALIKGADCSDPILRVIMLQNLVHLLGAASETHLALVRKGAADDGY